VASCTYPYQQVKSCGQRSDLSIPSTRCFRLEEIVFEESAIPLQPEAKMLAFIITGSTVLLQEKEALQSMQKCLFTLFTVERIFAFKAAYLFTIFTVERIFAFKAEYLFTLVTVERIFAVKTEYLFTIFAVERIFAVVAEYLFTLVTIERIFALKTK
jgi:hypothetical protein